MLETWTASGSLLAVTWAVLLRSYCCEPMCRMLRKQERQLEQAQDCMHGALRMMVKGLDRNPLVLRLVMLL